MRSALRGLSRGVLDVVLPRLCVSCRDPVTDEGVCASCWSQLSLIAEPFCPRLGIPFAFDPGPGVLSAEAVNMPPAFQRVRAVARYDDVARRLVHALKFQDRIELARPMGRWMARAGRELLADADAVLPVPLHWRRGFSRRFNQSGALAAAIGQASGRPVLREALRRVRATDHQIGLSRYERGLNVQGAFGVPAGRAVEVQGRRLVLVDDVLTSGATANACAHALLRAGAAEVDVLVFARVVDTRGGPI